MTAEAPGVDGNDVEVAARAPWPGLFPWQQESAAAMLADRARWPHALLVTGAAGIGKRALALEFARALLCETPRAGGGACGTCPSCRYVAAGQHPDLRVVEPVEIDDDNGEAKAVEWIAVDRIRRLIDWAQLTSHRRIAKVAVIVPAERMNAAAANALLKTLEEPPPSTYLILVTAAPGRIPATLRSRCRRLVAPRPDAAAATQWLDAQGVANPGALLAQAGGAPLIAQALADRGYQAERAVWLTALATPAALEPAMLAARIDAAPRDERRERIATLIDWLIAWCGDLALARAGVAPRRNADHAAAACSPGGRGGAGAPVSLSSSVAAATRRSSRTRCSPAWWRRRCSPITGACSADHGRQDRPHPAGGARPGVLSLNIREKAALYAAYMPFLKGGGIFIPTARQYTLGEEVFMLLSLMDDPNRIAVQGKVVWITPEGVQGNRTQGIGVQFTNDETGANAKATIERILGESLASTRATHTM